MKAANKSRLEYFLCLFTEVRRGEAIRALLMTINIFLILTAYLIAKVVREPLILGGGGAELKSYASAGQVVLLLGVIRIYAWLVSKYPRRQLINYVTVFFAACLIGFYVLLITIGPWNGVIYYLWVGIFSLVIIAQFWSFANDTYSPEQGKRLFVLMAFGASAGGVFGPMLAGTILDMVGLYNLLLVSAAVLLGSLLLTNYIESRIRSGRDITPVAGPGTEAPVTSKKGAMKVVFRSKYLILIALLILFTNWVNTTGEYILGRNVQNAAARLAESSADGDMIEKAFIGNFYANFYSIVGFAGLLMQLLMVSRILKYLGIRFALLTLPVIALTGYLSILLFPVLLVIRWAKTAENATDYSLNNTVRHILFLPTTKEEKYKAKVAIDSFFVRAGDVLSAALVFIGVTWFSFKTLHFTSICLGLVGVWIILAYSIGRINRDLVVSQSRNESDG